MRGIRYLKMTPPLLKVPEKCLPFLCHFVKCNREYYKWLSILRHYIQIGRLIVQTPRPPEQLQGSVIWGSMWSTGQASNKAVINIRRWRYSLPGGPSLALPRSNSLLETHFVFFDKTLAYSVFHLKFFSLISVHWNCVDSIYKTQKIIRFPTKIIYVAHRKLLQSNDFGFVK